MQKNPVELIAHFFKEEMEDSEGIPSEHKELIMDLCLPIIEFRMDGTEDLSQAVIHFTTQMLEFSKRSDLLPVTKNKAGALTGTAIFGWHSSRSEESIRNADTAILDNLFDLVGYTDSDEDYDEQRALSIFEFIEAALKSDHKKMWNPEKPVPLSARAKRMRAQSKERGQCPASDAAPKPGMAPGSGAM